MLEIDNEGDAFGGQTDDVGCMPASGKSVCVTVSGIGDQSALMNYTHELGHRLGLKHLYGTACNSNHESKFFYRIVGGPWRAATISSVTRTLAWQGIAMP